MSGAERQRNDVDIDSLLDDLKGIAAEAKELSETLHAEPALEPGAGERLIEDVAANLATTRQAVGLPPRGADQFAQSIRKQREELS